MDQWDDADHEQARDQKADADIHHRFDHDVSCTLGLLPECLGSITPYPAQPYPVPVARISMAYASARPLAKPAARPCSGSASTDVQNGFQVAVGVNLR